MRRRASEESGGRQTADRAARLGGISGLLYVVLFIPAYVVGYPDALDRASNEQGVSAYFDEVGTFLLFNGTLSIFAAFFFIWFLGALHGVLRSAEEEAGWFSSVALAGGVVFVTLAWAGVAIEIIGPAPAFAARVRGLYQWHVVVRLRPDAMEEMLFELPAPPGWSVDVDPQSLL